MLTTLNIHRNNFIIFLFIFVLFLIEINKYSSSNITKNMIYNI